MELRAALPATGFPFAGGGLQFGKTNAQSRGSPLLPEDGPVHSDVRSPPVVPGAGALPGVAIRHF